MRRLATARAATDAHNTTPLSSQTNAKAPHLGLRNDTDGRKLAWGRRG